MLNCFIVLSVFTQHAIMFRSVNSNMHLQFKCGYLKHIIHSTHTHKQPGPRTPLLHFWNKTSSLCSCLCLSLLWREEGRAIPAFCFTLFLLNFNSSGQAAAAATSWHDYKRKVVTEPPSVFFFLAHCALFISSVSWKWVRQCSVF